MVAVIAERSQTDDFEWLDGFCGVGGSSQGLTEAGQKVRAAANHSEWAIDQHAKNHPDTEHFRADLVDETSSAWLHPRDLPKCRFAWFSPACTDHSKAKGRKVYKAAREPDLFNWQEVLDEAEDDDPETAKAERSRMTMEAVYAYAYHHSPWYMVVENVVEVVKWGPNQDGSQFRDWRSKIESLGYHCEPVFVNAGFFQPCPQSRDRAYFVFTHRSKPKPDMTHRPDAWCASCNEITQCSQVFKQPTAAWRGMQRWGRHGSQYVYRCDGCYEVVTPLQVPSGAVINWAKLGPKIGERRKPLAERTLKRVDRLLRKARQFPPVVIRDGKGYIQTSPGPGARHATVGAVAGHTYERPGYTRARSMAQQSFTLAQTAQHGLVTGGMVEMRGGGSILSGQHGFHELGRTVTAGGFHHGVVTKAATLAMRGDGQVHCPTDPISTLTTVENHALVTGALVKNNGHAGDTLPHGFDEPAMTITARDVTSLVTAGTIPLTHTDDSDRGRHVLQELAALTASRERYLATLDPRAIEFIGPINVEEATFRMLDVDTEVPAFMGFRPDYQVEGTATQKMSGFGNAVVPQVAAWIAGQIMAALERTSAIPV